MADAWYLKVPEGNNSTNIEISGVVGAFTCAYEMAEDAPSYVSGNRYIFDIRLGAGGARAGWMIQNGASNYNIRNVASASINNVAVNPTALFAALQDDICLFEYALTDNTNGMFSFSARNSRNDQFFGLAVKNIVITDDNGVNTIDMTASGGTGTTLTSDTGNITLTLVGYPTDNSQWVLYDDGTGGGEVTPQLLALINASQSTQAQSLSLEQAQALVTTQAQQSTTASLLSLVQSLALESVSSQQVNTASLLSLAQTLLLDTINATQITQAETLTLSQRGSQALDLILASQTTNAELLSLAQSLKLASVNATQVSTTSVISLAQSLLIESIQAQQITNAETLTLEQTIGQSLSLASAQQVTQASLLSVEQQSKLALIVAQQVSQSQLIDIDSAQAISMVFAEQITTTETLDLTQQNVLIDGQVITLISATQDTTTETLLISKIALADLINAEQITTTTALSIAENSKLVTIDAEQVTLATLLNLSQPADGTSLKGLTLTDITSVYSLNEINKTIYTLKEI